MPSYSPLIEKALRRAARAHDQQTRKGSDLPYLTHPVGVMYLLLKAGYEDDELIAAALLHDVVEDTSVTLEQLRQEFPEKVCSWVAELSEKKKDSSGTERPWEDRKRDHLNVVQEASEGACAIVLADKLHNLQSMLYDLQESGETVWQRFNASPEQIIWYHQKMFEAAKRDDELNFKLLQDGLNTLDKLKAYLPVNHPESN